MKRLALLTLVSLSSAFACNPEAQFIGKVKNLQIREGFYTFQVDNFRYYVESGVCGLNQEDARRATLVVQGTPRFTNGSEISGVLSENAETGEFSIE